MFATIAAQSFNVIPLLAFQWPGWAVGALIAMFLFVCVIMVLTVLIQKPQGGGLASAFGGGVSAGQTAFGTKTGDALTVFTIAVFVAYLALAIILNYATRPYVIPAEPDAIVDGNTVPGLPAMPTPVESPATSPTDVVPVDPRAPLSSEPANGGVLPGSTPAAPTDTPADAPKTDPAAPTTTPVTNPATTPATDPKPAPENPAPVNPAPGG